VLVVALWVAPIARAGWSTPARPPGCAAALPTPGPLVVFPSAAPQTRSGPGTLLWTAPRGCAARGVGVEGAAETLGATLGADDLPGPGRVLVPAAGDLAVVTAATGTAAGGVLTVGSSAAAAASGYLGDAVLASPVRSPRGGWELAVRAQRHYSTAVAAPRLIPAGAGPVEAVAAALDYRADILLAWADRGGVYARELPATGAAGPLLRLGSAGADPEIGALVSDDGHAIVAWRSQYIPPTGDSGPSSAGAVGSSSSPAGRVGSGSLPAGALGGEGTSTESRARASTAVELSLFELGPGATLDPGSLRQVERFRDPPGLPLPPGSLRLIRLSSEAVMLAWTGLAADGRYVVRASPVSLRRGAWAPVTISGATGPRGVDSVLADLVPGPHAEALALWTAAPRLLGRRPDSRRREILAAQGHYAGAGEVAFAAPESVAPSGPNGTPVVAFDPQTGRALAAWVTLAGGQHIEYALRTAAPVALLGVRRTAASVAVSAVSTVPPTALACCLGLAPLYASIESSAIRIGTPLAACLK
jgi:hypothetical protein